MTRENGSITVAVMSGGILLSAWLTLLEFWIPYRKDWIARREEIFDNVLYLALVQTTFAKGLEYLWQKHSPTLHVNWPQNPIVLLVCMVLIGELGRYWIHRLAHRVPLFWKFHSIHHSPNRLHWWNTGRFHFLEKALQMGTESLLFFTLGIPVRMIGAYYLLYSVQGLLQHVNIDLKFGVLNYLISSVEQHRWHHSQDIQESNSNFGNKLSIYDLLFGTYFLPRGREVQKIGIVGVSGQGQFLAEVFSPFRTPDPAPRSLWLRFLGRLIQLRTQLYGKKTWNRLQALSQEEDFGQAKLLKDIIETHRHTEFAQHLGLNSIQSVDEFRKQIPILDYEFLRTWIDRQDAHGKGILNQTMPLFYATTSGTTGKPKFIPVTPETLAYFKESQNLWLYLASLESSDFLMGQFVSITGLAVEGHMPSGIPYGSTSGQIIANFPKIFRSKYIIPAFVFGFSPELKYLTLLRIILQSPNVTFLVTANPSTLIQLEKILNEKVLEFSRDLLSGEFHRLSSVLDPQDRKALARSLKPQPAMGKLLSEYSKAKRHIPLALIFPHLKMLSTWRSGSCKIAFERIRASFPTSVRHHDPGLLASEFRGTIPIFDDRAAGIPNLSEVFFEFRNKDESGDYRGLHQIKKGEEVLLFITTRSGLFRYKMNDIVKVVDFHGKLPLLEFVQKAKGVTSITGEKLYESQVHLALEATRKELRIPAAFYLLLADEHQSRYSLLIEEVAQDRLSEVLDHHLGQINCEYKAKRMSSRLGQIEVIPMTEGFQKSYLQHLVLSGQRESQLKVQHLQYMKEFNFKWELYLRNATRSA